jgi:hypothetical protein
LFEQWRLAKRMPFLREIGRQAVLDLLNSLTQEEIAALEIYFEDKIVVEKLNYSVAINLKVPLSDSLVCQELCRLEGFRNLSTWRDDEHLYVSLWR